ncbi:MAG: multicopper oxidase domain-containing protein, partial [Actinomycetales bacterium]
MTAVSLDRPSGATLAAGDGRPRATSTTSHRATWHRWANLVVLAYLLLSAAAVPARAVLPVPTWLAVHLLLLGAVTNAILIWSQHFAAALLRAPEPALRLRAARLGALNVGVVAVLTGVPSGVEPLTIAGAAVICAVVLWHLAAVLRLMRGALQGRFAATVNYYLASGVALLIGVPLGVTMTTTSAHADDVRAAHVHVNLLGWVGLAVLGTLFTLWPTVLRTPMVAGVEAAARRCFLASGLGVAAVLAGFLAELRWLALAGLLAYLAGVVVALRPFVATLRQRRPVSFAALSIAAAVAWFALALAADIVMLTLAPNLETYLARLPELVPAVLVGFVAQVLLGALSYLLPVMRGGGPSRVRASNAAVDTAAVPRVLVLNAAAALLAVAALTGDSRLLTLPAVALLALAAGSFVVLAGGGVLLRRRGDGDAAARKAPSAPMLGVLLGLAMTVVPVAVALSGGGTTAPTTVAVTGGGAKTVAVTLANMTISPKRIDVAPGTHLRLVVTNRDAMRHDLAFGGRQTPLLSRGEHATLDLGAVTQSLEGWCTVPGHRAAGMTMSIHVTGAAAPGSVGATEPSAATDGAPSFDVHGSPGPGWRPYNAALAPAPGGALHRVTMTVTDKLMEVAPGVTQRMWTFNGTVPGPVLRGHVGDVFEVTLVNRGSMDHGLDFHAGSVSPDDVMRTIAPGESLVYRFRAEHAGAW